MKRRKWMNGQKLQIVMEGLKGGRSVAEICNQHELSGSQHLHKIDQAQTLPFSVDQKLPAHLLSISLLKSVTLS